MWHLGHRTGLHQGWLAGRDDERTAWNRIIGTYREATEHPRHVELEAARAAPIRRCRSARCDCSACVRAGAVERNRARYGQPDYPGAQARTP